MKPKRFSFHFHKGKKMMSVHFEGKCHIVKNIRCHVNTETHYRKTQPYLIMRGYATEVIIMGETAHIYE